MSCNRNLKNCHYKTSEAVYNPNPQALTFGRQALTLTGTVITDTGVGATVNGNDITISTPGLYYIAADLTAAATEAGDITLALSRDSLLLPSTERTITAGAGATVSLHSEEILYIPIACGGASPVFNVVAAAAGAGRVSLVSARLVKLA